ncbi:hypothetical protein N657DRAFT_177131 [Parathielavia appendiculata]|uniref:Uncharacterized protein n=1 Tax=Parathielavia appendiculata TaxID=2587402 RepID=A0AAN6Z6W3_9PEZI|nr:hypothetical protein N657DRAFT_177131 [Parathielavia appendiculata]
MLRSSPHKMSKLHWSCPPFSLAARACQPRGMQCQPLFSVSFESLSQKGRFSSLARTLICQVVCPGATAMCEARTMTLSISVLLACSSETWALEEVEQPRGYRQIKYLHIALCASEDRDFHHGSWSS